MMASSVIVSVMVPKNSIGVTRKAARSSAGRRFSDALATTETATTMATAIATMITQAIWVC
jgi:hypothetical protein